MVKPVVRTISWLLIQAFCHGRYCDSTWYVPAIEMEFVSNLPECLISGRCQCLLGLVLRLTAGTRMSSCSDYGSRPRLFSCLSRDARGGHDAPHGCDRPQRSVRLPTRGCSFGSAPVLS
ncbi:hypothetical protein CALCODRAFT_6504 [Calocera cornea HHB12733]|uniref:Secreted protein n=1 Tax=Calocera cornea HHB12733 TaxID=1353952 RepID=A0A165KCC1_9BASI|nr:hypothetical protein CALCODRAFT_6504 [Calocera cornea HHB12733]